MAPLHKMVTHMNLHKGDGGVANLSTFSKAARSGLLVMAELLIALLDFHPYRPWHIKTFMSKAGKEHGAWCIPPQFLVQLSQAEREVTCLPYAVHPRVMQRQIPLLSGSAEKQQYDVVKANSMSVSIACQLRNLVRISLFYVQAIDKLKAILQHF